MDVSGTRDASSTAYQKTRTEWWENKITGNIAWDAKAIINLKDLGWNVLKAWECVLKKNLLKDTVNNISEVIKSNSVHQSNKLNR